MTLPRFPDPDPQQEEPQALASEERLELESLAEHLRSSWVEPELSEGLLDRIAGLAVPRWSMRSAVRANPVLRAAAVLMILSFSAVPVLAMAHLMAQPNTDHPSEIGFEVPEQGLPIETEEWQPEVVPPEVLDPEDSRSEDWVRAIQQENRNRTAAAYWQERFPVDEGQRSRAQLDVESGTWQHALEAWPQEAQLGLELRMGLTRATRGDEDKDWSRATAAEIWSEVQRRLARDGRTPMPEALTGRARQLWIEAPDASEARFWLIEAMWLLGEIDSVTQRTEATHLSEAQRLIWDAIRWDLPTLPSSY